MPQLDGIRGIAILLVLIFHFGVSAVGPQSNSFVYLVAQSLILTWSGVDLFFVLSGFLIGGILLDNRLAPNYFKVFYIRRICRIFPVYYLWLALFAIFAYVLATLILPGALRPLYENPLPFWSYATFTQNLAMAMAGRFGPQWLDATWSLAVEEQFYLTLPLIIRFVPQRRLPYLLITLIAATPILRTLVLYLSPNYALSDYVLLPCRADALLLGVLGAYLVRQERSVRYLSDHIKALYGGFAILILGAGVLAIYAPGSLSLAMTSYGYTWLALLYLVFILIAVIEKRGAITRLTSNAYLGRLGYVSYGVYLFHQTINAMVHAILLGQSPQLNTLVDFVVTLGAIALTIGIAILSWSLFERRVVAWGHSARYASPVT